MWDQDYLAEPVGVPEAGGTARTGSVVFPSEANTVVRGEIVVEPIVQASRHGVEEYGAIGVVCWNSRVDSSPGSCESDETIPMLLYRPVRPLYD